MQKLLIVSFTLACSFAALAEPIQCATDKTQALECAEFRVKVRKEDARRLATFNAINAANPNPKRAAKEGVYIGMTKAQALSSSWGRPNKVNRTTNAYGTSEQWVYGGHNYLYFQDDKLTSFQN